MTLLLLFRPPQAESEDIVVVVEPDIVPPIELEVVGIIVGPGDVGTFPRTQVKFPAGWK